MRTARMERIGAERIEILLREAKARAVNVSDDLPVKYVRRARKISMKLNLKTLGRHRDEFCKRCLAPFVTSSTFRVRYRNGKKVLTCHRCGAVFRRPYGKRTNGDRGRDIGKRDQGE